MIFETVALGKFVTTVRTLVWLFSFSLKSKEKGEILLVYFGKSEYSERNMANTKTCVCSQMSFKSKRVTTGIITVFAHVWFFASMNLFAKLILIRIAKTLIKKFEDAKI
jgi:hypothetical protein